MSLPLEEVLKFRPLRCLEGRRSDGDSAAEVDSGGLIQNPIRPTTSGANWLSVPSDCVGLWFRVGRGGRELSLYRISGEVTVGDDDDAEGEEEESSSAVTAVSAVELSECALHVSSSFDGRLVAVYLASGSVQCWNVTNNGMTERWKDQSARSSSGGTAEGSIVSSFQFSPSPEYALLVVSSSTTSPAQRAGRGGGGQLKVYGADNSAGATISPVFLSDSLEGNVTAAAWAPRSATDGTNTCTLAVGDAAGEVFMYEYSAEAHALTRKTDTAAIISSREEEGWACTHLGWYLNNPGGGGGGSTSGADTTTMTTTTTLVAGYCKFEPAEDEEYEGLDPAEDDDPAQVEASVTVLDVDLSTLTTSASSSPSDLGDVVPFFGVPLHGRHLFLTTAASTTTSGRGGPIVMVGANVGTDVMVLSRSEDNEDNDGDCWAVTELPEGDNVATPTNDDDEFMFPTGMATLSVPYNKGSVVRQALLLTATDGSLSSWLLSHDESENYFTRTGISSGGAATTTLLPATPVAGGAVRSAAAAPAGVVAKSEDNTSEPDLAPEPPAAVEESSSAPAAAATTTTTPAAPFGSGIAGAPPFSFGTTATKLGTPPANPFSSLGSTTATPFGAAAATSSSTASPFSFGQTATSFAPASASTASSKETTPALKPAFGSGGVTTSVFGSGSGSALTFGSGSASGGGFASLAAAAKTSSPFGGSASDANASPFALFNKPETSAAAIPSSMMKPLFGSPTTTIAGSAGDKAEKEKPQQPDERASPKVASFAARPSKEVPAAAEPEEDKEAAAARKAASSAFDGVDTAKSGKVPVSRLVDLLDELGSGFYGDEYDAVLEEIKDKDEPDAIRRRRFLDWYVALVASQGKQANDDESLDSEERAEREEEADSARQAFWALSENESNLATIPASKFGDLLESMGTTYCDEAHAKYAKKLSRSDGTIRCQDFVDWYVPWLFDGDDDEDEDDDTTPKDDAGDGCKDRVDAIKEEGWGDRFRTSKDSWRCPVCMVTNKATDTKCPACEAPRPGYEESADSSKEAGTASSGSAIGSGGFTFGGAVAAAPAKADDPAKAARPSGFGFGTAPGGFSFGTFSASTKQAEKGVEASDPSKSFKGFTFVDGGAKATKSDESVRNASATKGGSTVGLGFSFPVKKSEEVAKTSPSVETSIGSKGVATTKEPADDAATKAARESASTAFEGFDKGGSGKVPASQLADLLDELGCGFHGDEYDAVLDEVKDPDEPGVLVRQRFLDWYVNLVSAQEKQKNDNESLDSDERAEREEEAASAREAFSALANNPGNLATIPETKFGDLLESMGTTYCEEAHAKFAKQLSRSDGKIRCQDFVDWYVPWLFDGNDDDGEDGEDDTPRFKFGEATKGEAHAIKKEGWGDRFQASEGSWRCEVCMVTNQATDTKCPACEAPRPGYEEVSADSSKEAGTASAGSAIGSGGFSFGATSAKADEPVQAAPSSTSGFGFGTGTGGFSFGVSSAPATTTGSGFSFGKTAGSFSFGNEPPSGKVESATVGAQAKPSPASSPSKPVAEDKSSKASTPSSAKEEAKSTSSFPPMSTKAPTPFSSSIASSVDSQAAAFPPMSNKAPTPFSFSQDAKVGTPDRPSSSAFPPMSTKAPTPFSAAAAASKGSATDTSPTSSAFPPMSTSAPTPFSFSQKAPQPAAPEKVAFPPMSGKAPTPFSAKQETPVTKKDTSSSFPPMSSKAPKPFSASQGTAVKQEESSAFPPMSSKAPTPFSASTAGASVPKTTPSSAFPPMSNKAPTPFSAARGAPATKKDISSFPPMSSKAPTPFSASKETASTKQDASSFPPMSNKAPTPFSASLGASSPKTPGSSFPQASSKTPTSFAAAQGTPAAKNDGSSFPPMSTKAPQPFSLSQGATATKGGSSAFPPMSSKAPTPFSFSQSASVSKEPSSAFPPMSNIAPTPFSAAQGGQVTKKDSSSFPPMSSKAPTPFSAAKETTSTKRETSAFPPMSNKAPTPFSSSQGVSSTKTPESFPPMSSKPPTPFSAVRGTSAAQKDSSSFPPMSSKAPKPFSGTQGSTVARSPASSGYPPMSSKAPKPFSHSSTKSSSPYARGSPRGSSTAKASPLTYPSLSEKSPSALFGREATGPHGSTGYPNASTAFGSKTFTQSPVGASTTRDASPSGRTQAYSPMKQARSGVESSPSVSTSTSMDASRVRSRSREASSASPEKNRGSEYLIQFAGLTKKLLSTLNVTGEGVRDHEQDGFQRAIEKLVEEKRLILGALIDIENSVVACKDRNGNTLSKRAHSLHLVEECRRLVGDDGSGDNLILNEPLDSESERMRRHLSAQAVLFHRRFEMIQRRLKVIEKLGGPDGFRELLQAILQIFGDVKGFAQVSLKIEDRGLELSNFVRGASLPPHLKSHARLPKQITERAPAVKQKKSEKWRSVAKNFQGLLAAPTLKNIKIESPVAKSVRTPLKPDTPTSAQSRMLTPLFSPPSSAKCRSGWDKPSTVDQSRAKQISFSAPAELREVSVSTAARDALAGFGTTPEKVKETLGVMQQRPSQTSVSPSRTIQAAKPIQRTSEDTKAKKVARERDGAAFPPLSVKAPTPVSEKLKAGVSPKPSTSVPFALKTASSGQGAAPTPAIPTPSASSKGDSRGMSGGGASKVSTSGFSDMSGLGESLFSTASADSVSEAPKVPPSSSAVANDAGPDFGRILTSFYQTHNPSKLVEVTKTLEKYKGREAEMFAKLAKKYGVPNPLDKEKPSQAVQGSFGGGAPASLSAAPATGMTGMDQASIPFGNQNPPLGASPFGSPAPGPSPFGTTPSAPPPASTFGNAAKASPFAMNSPTMSTPAPFGGMVGQPAPPPPVPAPSGPGASFGGRSPREILTAFYQQYNPSKVSEVDRLLAKYQGNEEQMFRNLAKKYNLDPSQFGLPPVAVGGSPGFGQPSVLGGGSTFGAAPAPTPFGSAAPGGGGFGQPTALGGGFPASTPQATAHTFGAGTNQSYGSPSFGALAQSPPAFGGGFSPAAPAAPFGTATPFGAPRR